MAIQETKLETTQPKFKLLPKRWQKIADDEYHFDLKSTVEMLNTKAILNTNRSYIELVNYGFLQFMEITGKDLESLSEIETLRTITNYELWLTQFTADFQIETTNLPTNTDPQTVYLRHHLALVRQELRKVPEGSRLFLQLKDKETYLRANIEIEEQVEEDLYNREFILWLWGEDSKELDEVCSKAKRYGNNDFVPNNIPAWKKVQILKQYCNMNEKI
ncbi:hypothetical protein [Streptococcus sobrinus]|uniref:hypothetical protein n=1 Tax=Streptococcus sobrinus TaxID=1310 RepID=UPI0002EF6EC8|nr:hypothetical protein [Streptococcus sobrinus]